MKIRIIQLVIFMAGFNLIFFTSCFDKDYPIINDTTDVPTGSGVANIRGYKDCYLGTFRCGLFIPRSYNEGISYPLIIYLHGYSDTTSWALEWYKDPLANSNPCIVLTPKCPIDEYAGWGDSWNQSVSPMMKNTFKMYDLVDMNYNIDHDRIYIYGTSMGGYGTYAAIWQHPTMFAAAFVECGTGNTDLAGIIKNIPFWIFHGSDDPIVPVLGSRAMYKAVIESGGTQIRYTEYPGVKHNTWDYVKNETTLPYWLFAQRKGTFHNSPDSVMNINGIFTDDHHVTLSWSVITGDENKDKNYWFCRIYRNDSLIAEIYNDINVYTDTTAQLNTTYHYKITAVNFFFKESAFSAPLSVTTTP
jgi:predicted esterase